MTVEHRAGLEVEAIERRIFEFMQRELLTPEVSIDRSDDLLSGDVLDSMALMRLAAFVEEAFDFEIQPADYVVENFQTVAALAGYVSRAAGHSGSDPALTDV
jgi:acyl carrier protein